MEIKVGDFVVDVRRHESIYPSYPIVRKSVGIVKKIYRAFVIVKWANGPEAGIPARYLEIVNEKGKQKHERQQRKRSKSR